jgi:small subunit ribosomal protein S2
VQFPIPGNDDAIRANELMSRVICEAVIEGRYIAEKSGNRAVTTPSAPVTRTPQEQAEFDAQQEAARKSAAAAQAERDARVAQAGEKAEG